MPFPPSVNTVTAVVRGRKITSAKGRQYRKEAVSSIAEQHTGPPLTGRLDVTVVLMPPDRRQRDIDNYSKACLDAITAAGVWGDDDQVDCLTIIRAPVIKGGSCRVEISEVAE